MDELIERIKSSFDEDGDVEIDEENVRKRLDTLINEYSVPENEAVRSVISGLSDEHGVDSNQRASSGGLVNVGDIDTEGEWVSVEVTMDREWDASHSSIGQTGIVGDETGTIKFTAWDDADQPLLEEGVSYRLDNVVTDSYQGQMSIQLQSSSEVTELDEEIEVGEKTVEVEGVLVDLQSGSGLIKRDPESGKVIHDDVDNEGEFDIRLKTVIDDGIDTYQVIFGTEATEEVTGMSIEDSKTLAKKQLDTSVVLDEMREAVINRYYRIDGPEFGRYTMVDSFEELGEPDESDIEELRERIK